MLKGYKSIWMTIFIPIYPLSSIFSIIFFFFKILSLRLLKHLGRWSNNVWFPKTLSHIYIMGCLHKISETLMVRSTSTTTKSLRNASVHFYLFPCFLLFFHSVYFCFLFACFYFDILTVIQWWRHLFVLYAWEGMCVCLFVWLAAV